MAKDAKAAVEGAEAAPKKSKKLLIIILAVVLLVVLGGGAAFMLLKKGDHEEGDEEVAEETAKPKKKDKKKDAQAAPVFVNMEPFTVNLVPETGDQYLQAFVEFAHVHHFPRPQKPGHSARLASAFTGQTAAGPIKNGAV